ncbi:HNH endonuclease [Streptomyces sp. NPDC007991]|uniref:HNH endonuclease signature motif containing protein n=1 Tax=Streptomyces sp. NPDC007991 TaxID=3364803 RepID=UPI0036EF1421
MDRITERVTVNDAGCWIYTGHLDRYGYGRISYEGKSREAYRIAYEHSVGPVPAGMELDHLCRVRQCVNPNHLEAVSPATNKLRSNSFGGVNARKTACVHGHPYTSENTGYQNNGKYRYCKECRRRTNRSNRQRRQKGQTP